MFGGDKPGQDKFDKLKEVLGWLETFVAEDKFSAGTDCITVGDLALLATYSTMKAADLAGIDLSTFPNCEAWFEKCCKLVPNYEKGRKVVVISLYLRFFLGKWRRRNCLWRILQIKVLNGNFPDV